ncbi:MAG: hypothetical protein EU547_01980 [Promethearchaeota archaeon]|nr:MAG: hypothetical protein EU547_01980 [Candidatus Lokiarchaeota archaeon]
MSPNTVDKIKLRSYPKIIFFYPLLISSFILWLIQLFFPTLQAFLGYFWFAMFFINCFVIAFDFSSAKFFVLILLVVIAIVSVIAIFVLVPDLPLPTLVGFNFGLTVEFYLGITVILAFVLAIVVINAQFNYWELEQNEIYHKKGIFSSADRYPTERLRLKKAIPDVFEFLFLRAGSLTLIPGSRDDAIHLSTVLNINNKIEAIDKMLSYVSVEPDEVDNI